MWLFSIAPRYEPLWANSDEAQEHLNKENSTDYKEVKTGSIGSAINLLYDMLKTKTQGEEHALPPQDWAAMNSALPPSLFSAMSITVSW